MQLAPAGSINAHNCGGVAMNVMITSYLLFVLLVVIVIVIIDRNNSGGGAA